MCAPRDRLGLDQSGSPQVVNILNRFLAKYVHGLSMCPTVSTVRSAAYTRRRTGLAFLQVMACPLFGTESFPEQRLTYSQLDYSE